MTVLTGDQRRLPDLGRRGRRFVGVWQRVYIPFGYTMSKCYGVIITRDLREPAESSHPYSHAGKSLDHSARRCLAHRSGLPQRGGIRVGIISRLPLSNMD
jgi:hypothetical protein